MGFNFNTNSVYEVYKNELSLHKIGVESLQENT